MSLGFANKALTLPGAVAAWGGDPSGQTWEDRGTNGLDLTAVGAVWSATGGPNSDGAWVLDGVDDYLGRRDGAGAITTDSLLDLGSSGDGYFWAAVWVKADEYPIEFNAWAAKGDDTWLLSFNGGSTANEKVLRFRLRGGASGDIGVTGTSGSTHDVTLTAWTFVVFQVDVLDGTQRMRLRQYSADGTVQFSGTSDRAGLVGVDNLSSVVLGAQDAAGTLRRWWDCDIAGFAVGNGDYLTLAQMEELRASTFEAGPVGPFLRTTGGYLRTAAGILRPA